MELLYKNSYGASYRIENAPNPICTVQLIVDCIGLFMSEADLAHLLEVVKASYEPCFCEECKETQGKKIWSTSPFHDLALKVDATILKELEDLIVGTQFLLNMDETLKQYRLKPNQG